MSHRSLSLAAFAMCALLIATALYFQYFVGMAPCPLCIVQRVAFIAVGVILLIAGLHNPRAWGWRAYGGFAALCALLGAAVAGRHVWLQNLPADRVPECGPGLAFMLDVFPFRKVIDLVLRGSGECADVQWQLLGLTMPGWSLLWFLALALLGSYLAVRPRG